MTFAEVAEVRSRNTSGIGRKGITPKIVMNHKKKKKLKKKEASFDYHKLQPQSRTL